MSKAPTDELLVVFQTSLIDGVGAFANAAIPQGTHIMEYVGEPITKAESLRRCEESNEYIFTLNDKEDLDGNVAWNPARFFNHSCAPNCDAQLENGHIWIISNRDIL